MITAAHPLLALAFLSSPAMISPSHFAFAGTITPISSVKQCNDLLRGLHTGIPYQINSQKRAALYKASSVMARLCAEQKFGQAARQYQALKGALKAYRGQP